MGRTGSALDPAEDDLAANISFPAMIPMDAEVVCIEKRIFVIPVTETVLFDFFRNGRGILAQEACDVLKRGSCGKFLFNVKMIL